MKVRYVAALLATFLLAPLCALLCLLVRLPRLRKGRPDPVSPALSARRPERGIDVVVTSYNTREYLLRFVESIRRHCPHAHILVVDDASTDGSPEALRKNFPEVELLSHDENLGYTASANDGLAAARHDVVFLANSDVELRADVLTPMAEYLRARPEVGVVACKMRNEDGTLYRNLIRGEYGWLSLLEHSVLSAFWAKTPWFRRMHRRLLVREEEAYEMPHENLTSVSFALAGFRYDALTEVGGVDESFAAYFDDPDLCRRIRRTGRRVAYLPIGEAVHYGKKSFQSRAAAFPILCESRILYLQKHGPRGAVLPARLFGVLGALAHWLHGTPGWNARLVLRTLRRSLIR